MNSHHTSFQHHSLPVQHSVHASSDSSQLVNSHRTVHNIQPAGTDFIGKPIHFSTGQFAGRIVRAELIEIQKADLGRKYARVDRRPLDPPPVVLLKLYSVYHVGNEQREEEVRDYDEVHSHGLICTVDLFPVPGADRQKDSSNGFTPHSPMSTSSQTSFQSQPSRSEGRNQNVNYLTAQAYVQQATLVTSPTTPVRLTHALSGYPPSPTSLDVIHHIGDFGITEGSKQTQALVGATFVQPATVEYQGRKSLVFVFSDLAVKIEGTFILRYRVFDLFSRPYDCENLVIQAECYGGQFKVYSTKEFPGLQASTELTKQLARWGVRLNIRETERKRRKKDDRSTSPAPSRRKRSHRSMSDTGHSDGE